MSCASTGAADMLNTSSRQPDFSAMCHTTGPNGPTVKLTAGRDSGTEGADRWDNRNAASRGAGRFDLIGARRARAYREGVRRARPIVTKDLMPKSRQEPGTTPDRLSAPSVKKRGRYNRSELAVPNKTVGLARGREQRSNRSHTERKPPSRTTGADPEGLDQRRPSRAAGHAPAAELEGWSYGRHFFRAGG